MCDETAPCACTLERRAVRRADHIARADALTALASRLRGESAISDDEAELLFGRADAEWDDATHIASQDDPLRSLCGHFGRNLTDLPDRPDSGSGCWTCLTLADKIAAKERVAA